MTVSTEHDVRTYTLAGRVDRATVDELISRLWRDGGDDREAIVLNLAGVASIDAGGLAALFSLKDMLGRRLQVRSSEGGPWPVTRNDPPALDEPPAGHVRIGRGRFARR